MSEVLQCRKCGIEGTKGEEFYPYSRKVCKKCHYAYQKDYRRRNAGKTFTKDKKYAIKKRYGLSVEQFEGMADALDWRCAVCRDDPSERSSSPRQQRTLHVDHDHVTGQVRGLLCNGCNRAAGFLNDDPERAMALADYLLKGQALNFFVKHFLPRIQADKAQKEGVSQCS